jgi:hypothetical protein
VSDRDMWFNLGEKSLTMTEGVKFCGIISNAEVWLVKDKAVEEFLRKPSAKPIQAVSQARAELRDRFAMAALTGMVGCGDIPNLIDAKAIWRWADLMLETREENSQ